MSNFDPLRRSRRFQFSSVVVLNELVLHRIALHSVGKMHVQGFQSSILCLQLSLKTGKNWRHQIQKKNVSIN